MTIGDLLTAQAKSRPSALALIDDRARKKLTFAELDHAVAHAAEWWRTQGLRRGRAVLVFVPMSADLYVALLGLFRLGAVALFLDPAAGREHLERCCARWAPDALLAIPKAHLLRFRSAALRRIPLKINVGGWVPFSIRWPQEWPTEICLSPADAEPADPALVTFTSGSTGTPKATVRTHRFLLNQYRALAPNLALVAGEVDLATLPVFVLANLAAGVTTVIPDADLRRPDAVDAESLFAQIDRYGVNRITAAPAFFEKLIEFGHAQGRTLPALRKLYTGGAPVFPRLLEALGSLAPQAEAVAVYGSTEAEPIAHISAHEMGADDLIAMKAGRGLLAGIPVAGIKLAILADQWGAPRCEESAEAFARLHLPVGRVGEIVVTGDHVLTGYLGGVGDHETKFKVAGEVWHRTGDAGYRDDTGRLWLMGRCSARIDDRDGRLYPFAVECVALTFPAVRRAAVLAHHSERLLFVAATRDFALAEELKSATAPWHIQRVIFCEDLPVDSRHNSKIDYVALRKLADRLVTAP